MNKFQVQLYIRNERVDLFEKDQITIRQRIQDVRDVSKVFASFSHSFALPASKTNNKILKHIFRQDTSTIDPRAYHEAYIEIDNNPFLRGYILAQTGTYKSGVVHTYNIRFFGGLVNMSRTIGNDFLADLDFTAYDTAFDTGISLGSLMETLLVNSPNTAASGVSDLVNADMRTTLNSFDDGYYYDSAGTSDAATRREGYRNIYWNPATNDFAFQGRQVNGVLLNRIKPSLRNTAILKAIETKYGDAGILFSKGVDANGFPTAIAADVVDNHFLNTPAFTESYTLLHSKVEDEDLDSRPEEIVMFDAGWGRVTAAGNLVGTDTLIRFTSETSGGNPLLSSNYFIRVDVTRGGGSGRWQLKLIDEDANELWSSGQQSQNWSTAEQMGSTVSESLVRGSGRNGLSGGSIQNGVGSSRWNGVATDFVQIIFPPDGTTTLFANARFVLQRDSGVEVDIREITIYNEYRTNRSGIFGIRNFERNVRRSTNTKRNEIVPEDGAFSVGSDMPRIKVLEWITGIWKLWNMTAYVARNAQGNDIIITQSLDQYYDQGNIVDLTEYVDNQEYTISAPVFFNPIVFKYKDPSTYLAKEWFESNRGTRKYGYASLSDDRTEDQGLRQLPYKEYKVEVPFEQVVLNQMVDEADRAEASNIVYGWIVSESREPTNMAPWIHYIDNAIPTNSILAKTETGNVEITRYNAPSKTLFIGTEQDQSLTFGIENIERLSGEGFGTLTEKTLFTELWQRYIRSVFNGRARLISLDARLPRSLMTTLTLADTIILSNDSYRINKLNINTANGQTTLELISLNDAVIATPVELVAVTGLLTISDIIQDPVGPLTSREAVYSVSSSGGTDDPVFSWRLNGNTLSGETTNRLALTNLNTGDTLVAIVVSDVETAVSNEFVVEVQDQGLGDALTDQNDEPLTDHNGDPLTD